MPPADEYIPSGPADHTAVTFTPPVDDTNDIIAELLKTPAPAGDAQTTERPEPRERPAKPAKDAKAAKDAKPAAAAVEDDNDEPDAGDEVATDDEDADAGDDQDADTSTALAFKKNIRALVKAKNYKALFAELDVEPEDLGLDPKAWTAWRAANAREFKKLKGQERAAEQRLGAWDTNLRNAQAQQQQKDTELTAREARVKFYEDAEAAYEKDGDPKHIVAMIERATKRPYDEAQRDILHKVRRTPGERRMQDQLEAQAREIAELRGTVTKPAEQPKPDAAAEYAQDINIITQQATAAVKSGALHADAIKVPHFAKRVYRVLLETKGPIGLTKTVEEAARMVLQAERIRLKRHPLAAKVTPAPEVTPAPRKGGKNPDPPMRSGSRSPGAEMRPENESNDDIINYILKKDKTNRAVAGR